MSTKERKTRKAQKSEQIVNEINTLADSIVIIETEADNQEIDEKVVVKKRHVKSQDDYINEFVANVEKHFNISERRTMLFLIKHFYGKKTKGPIHKYFDGLLLKLFKNELVID